MKLILLIHSFSTVFMVGLIWFVQIVHYPLFNHVGREQFRTYEELHQRLTTWIVAPAMLVELVTAVMLLKDPPAESSMLVWIGAGLVVLIWLATAALSVPAHKSLSAEFSALAWQSLVATNWIRTIAWSVRGILVFIILHRVMAAKAA
jgi:uncharacterized membrane protein